MARKYRAITSGDEKLKRSCYDIFRKYGDKVGIAVFEQEMRERLGFVPEIIVDEDSPKLKKFRELGTLMLRQDDEFIYSK
jgi:hypothetical protein